MKLGQTYVVEGDGRWFGNATLLLVTKNEAIFLIEYFDNEKERTSQCIWHALKKDFNPGLQPDLTVLLDVPIEIGLNRRSADSEQWNRLDASQPLEDVCDAVKRVVLERVKQASQ